MLGTDTHLPAFEGELSVPIVTYLVVLFVLSLFLVDPDEHLWEVIYPQPTDD